MAQKIEPFQEFKRLDNAPVKSKPNLITVQMYTHLGI